MAYEGQIAGVTDAARTPYGAAVRVMKALSAREIAERRAATVAAMRQIADLAFVNGGGTGSIETTRTEDAVTEIAAGSGLIGPGLFDGYHGFCPRPARRRGRPGAGGPAPGAATRRGGGWVASGAPGRTGCPPSTIPRACASRPRRRPVRCRPR